MFQYCKITHLAFFSFKCGLDIFFRNVASENSSHLSESRAGQNAGFVSAEKPRPKSHYTEEKGKENGKKAKTKEGEKHNSPCLGFFCFLLLFLLCFFLLFSLPILWRRFSPQLPNNDSHFFGGKVRLEFLKSGL